LYQFLRVGAKFTLNSYLFCATHLPAKLHKHLVVSRNTTNLRTSTKQSRPPFEKDSFMGLSFHQQVASGAHVRTLRLSRCVFLCQHLHCGSITTEVLYAPYAETVACRASLGQRSLFTNHIFSHHANFCG